MQNLNSIVQQSFSAAMWVRGTADTNTTTDFWYITMLYILHTLSSRRSSSLLNWSICTHLHWKFGSTITKSILRTLSATKLAPRIDIVFPKDWTQIWLGLVLWSNGTDYTLSGKNSLRDQRQAGPGLFETTHRLNGSQNRWNSLIGKASQG